MAMAGSVAQAPPTRPCGRGSCSRRRRRWSCRTAPDMICAAAMLHGFKARGAEAVDLHARRRFRRNRHSAPRCARCRSPARPPGSTQPSTTSSTMGCRDCCGRATRLQHLGGELQRRHFMQRAVFLAAPARRAHGVVDIAVGHGAVLAGPPRSGTRKRLFARSAVS